MNAATDVAGLVVVGFVSMVAWRLWLDQKARERAAERRRRQRGVR